ncbi:hypothetical protein [Arthrobacter agilis]|uniref:hypothetical protein n=1 Tax=Arthrobacter agilis TaxID=37921 RepID=UPI002780B323|nr:hypothetical protein [Arthrobacter agilis]MDQ0736562.1 hypothetical protein [Arthrobacter agilis]
MAWSARPGLAALAAILLTACATPGSPGGPGGDAPRAAAPAAVQADGTAAAPAADGEVIGQGTVRQDGADQPEFCLGGVMESYPPQCSGPPIIDWDWQLAGGFEEAFGVTWGAYAVTGTWDGQAFTRTGMPIPLSLYDAMPFDDPLAGRHGATDPLELERIRQEVHLHLPGHILTAETERGFVVVTVVYDDGTFQAQLDAVYGTDVVVVLSALQPSG